MQTKLNKKEKIIKFIDGIIIFINIATNVALLFLMGDILNGFAYTNALLYNFTTLRYIEIGIFLIAQVSGLYLMIKFFTSQNLKGRLLITTIPLTIILVAGLWFFYNAPNININGGLTFSKALGITQGTYETFGFEYVLIAVLVYILILFAIYSAIFKKSENKKDNKRKKT